MAIANTRMRRAGEPLMLITAKHGGSREHANVNSGHGSAILAAAVTASAMQHATCARLL